MKWRAILTTEDDLRSALKGHPGIEFLAEGGPRDLRAFLEGYESLKKPIVILTMGSAPIPSEAEGGLDIASDPRLMATLVDLVNTRVKDMGGAIIDLQEYNLSVDAALEVARRAGLEVSIGLKAVYAPRDEDESLPA